MFWGGKAKCYSTMVRAFFPRLANQNILSLPPTTIFGTIEQVFTAVAFDTLVNGRTFHAADGGIISPPPPEAGEAGFHQKRKGKGKEETFGWKGRQLLNFSMCVGVGSSRFFRWRKSLILFCNHLTHALSFQKHHA
jgi:hypothetical protein